MKAEGKVTAQFHEVKSGLSKKTGNSFRVLVIRVEEDFEKHELFLPGDVVLPADLKQGDKISINISVKSFMGRSDFRITSIVKAA